MKTSPFHGWFSGRNRWITLGSLAAVGITGAMAFGANLGLLKASNSSAVGAGASQLIDNAAPGTTIVDVYVTDPAPTTAVPALTSPVTAPAATAQPYAVANAGVVTVESSAAGLRLSHVQAAQGYTWSMLQGSPRQLVVTLSNGAKKYQFRASADASGTVSVKVTDITPAPQQQPPAGGDDDGGESDD